MDAKTKISIYLEFENCEIILLNDIWAGDRLRYGITEESKEDNDAYLFLNHIIPNKFYKFDIKLLHRTVCMMDRYWSKFSPAHTGRFYRMREMMMLGLTNYTKFFDIELVKNRKLIEYIDKCDIK